MTEARAARGFVAVDVARVLGSAGRHGGRETRQRRSVCHDRGHSRVLSRAIQPGGETAGTCLIRKENQSASLKGSRPKEAVCLGAKFQRHLRAHASTSTSTSTCACECVCVCVATLFELLRQGIRGEAASLARAHCGARCHAKPRLAFSSLGLLLSVPFSSSSSPS